MSWIEKPYSRKGVIRDIKRIRKDVIAVIDSMIKNKNDQLLLELLMEMEFMCEYYPTPIKKSYPVSRYKWVEK